MKLVKVNVDKLVEDPENARKHNKKNLDAIEASLKRFGQRIPLTVREGVVVAGNGRLSVMRKLGLKTAYVVNADDLTEEEARQFALADNRTAELAEWDAGKLTEMLRAFQPDDIPYTGFTQKEADKMFNLADLAQFTKDNPETPAPEQPGTKKTEQDGSWFYVEFYGRADVFEKLKEAIGDGMRTAHEVEPHIFEEMVKAWLQSRADLS